MPTDLALLARIDAFLDATVRDSADGTDVGVMRVFLSRRPWPYYARPRCELDLAAAGAVTVEDVRAAADVLAAAGAPVAFEWVPEVVPSMADAVAALGLAWSTAPLMLAAAAPVPAPALDGVALRLVGPDDAELEEAARVSAAGFASAVIEDIGPIRHRVAAGLNVTVVAEVEGEGVVGTATLQPLGTMGEVVGVSVLPQHRRRGIGGELTRFLVGEAHRRGVSDVLLSAAPSAAGVYRRLGFRTVGTLASAPPDDDGAEPSGP